MVLTRNELEVALRKEVRIAVRIAVRAERYVAMLAKACGRSERNSMNLWGGIDAPAS